MRWLVALLALGVALIEQAQGQGSFEYYPPGLLRPARSGLGAGDRFIYAPPQMIFPLRLTARQQAYVNSQVWGVGGMYGPRGLESSPNNYRMPWADTYCERRSWKMPLCPGGQGHQGVDIRGPTREDSRWEAVAVETGRIEHLSRYSVLVLRGDSGTRYRYMHLDPRTYRVQVGQRVERGAVLGRISNFMGGRPGTTIHLHFDIEQTLMFRNGPRRIFVPPYTSLVVAYRRLKGLPPLDRGRVLGVDPRREVGARPQRPILQR